MVVSSLEGYTLFKGITGVYFYSFESIITLSLSLFYLTKLIFMKIVRFKTVGGKSLVMISLLLMAPMHFILVILSLYRKRLEYISNLYS